MNEPGTHKMTEAVKGQLQNAKPDQTDPSRLGPASPTHAEVAEQARIAEEARPNDFPDQDERLTRIGRGQQTHG